MSHQASATSAPTHATVIRAPNAMTIRIQSARSASAERVLGTAASGVEPCSRVSVGGIWALPCGGLGSRVETHPIPKSHRDTQMGERHWALDQLQMATVGGSKPVSPPPQYRRVGPLMGNDETSDPNDPVRPHEFRACVGCGDVGGAAPAGAVTAAVGPSVCGEGVGDQDA